VYLDADDNEIASTTHVNEKKIGESDFTFLNASNLMLNHTLENENSKEPYAIDKGIIFIIKFLKRNYATSFYTLTKLSKLFIQLLKRFTCPKSIKL